MPGSPAPRISKLRACMQQKHLDAVLLSGKANIAYYSGFQGDDTLLCLTLDHAWLLTDSRYTIQAKTEAPEWALIDNQQAQWTKALAGLICPGTCPGLGLDARRMPASLYMELKDVYPRGGFTALDADLLNFRMVKDKEETARIRQAALIADQAFFQVLQSVREGVSELELTAELEYRMKQGGAQNPSFETIVAFGERTAMPHAHPTRRRLKAGDALLFDFGAVFEGYRSDATRTFFLGEPGPEMRKIYSVVQKAQQEALLGIRPGLSGREADYLARKVIEMEGYGSCFGHGTGHGVGLEIHEDPRLSPKYEGMLPEGCVVTVEPGIYLEGTGGVRIEDLVVLDAGGAGNLTGLSRELMIL
ncbi:MAG TPA: hypothetical protein DD727_00215 [Clostridiales bacterium]|nr:hypothetical protein [Clostridiales bacterium]